MLYTFSRISRNDPYMHYRRFYLRFRKWVEIQWFIDNHPTHFAAYRLPTKSVPGLLCLTLFEREEYFEQGSPKPLKKFPLESSQQRRLQNLHPLSLFHSFTIFKMTLKRTLSQNHAKKRIGGGLFKYFSAQFLH